MPLPPSLDPSRTDIGINTAFECVAGLGPALLLYAGLSGVPSEARPQESEPRVIDVTMKRFTFDPPRIKVTEGEAIRLVVRSADGTHGFTIKKFGVEEQVPRGGVPVTIELTAAATGRFPIVCSEYCGKGHKEMRALLVVMPRKGGTR